MVQNEIFPKKVKNIFRENKKPVLTGLFFEDFFEFRQEGIIFSNFLTVLC